MGLATVLGGGRQASHGPIAPRGGQGVAGTGAEALRTGKQSLSLSGGRAQESGRDQHLSC